MREILKLCAEMDQLAERTYAKFAEANTDASLRDLFRQMSAEEGSHVGWWTDLLTAFDQGLLPNIMSDESGLVERMRSLSEELHAMISDDSVPTDPEGALALAARIEFYLIDPVFGELIDLTEPGRAEHRRAAYSTHLERLISAIEEYYAPGSLASFLAGILARTWHDNLTLAVYATRDPLTGIYNRRALDTHLHQWSAWSARYGRPLTVLLIDVDFFKGINDEFGHRFGDRVLRDIAHVVRSAVRSSDLVVRYGGDEFAVIAPETDSDEYCLLVDRILETVRKLELTSDDGHAVPVSVSIGGTVAVDPAGSNPRSIDKLLSTADQGLYAAKQAGRNRASDPIVLGRDE
ncbi:MAG: diguanylate cyclase [Coriobacteriia bacterium]|nr:diguanylate cyclase [Coriobacteriia bacterium]